MGKTRAEADGPAFVKAAAESEIGAPDVAGAGLIRTAAR